MPDSEQQEAVCGTCGSRIRQRMAGTDLAYWEHVPDHNAIPAPVVPSDDEQCAFPNSQWGVCGIPESAHADLMEPLAGSRFHHEYQRPASPTPSQDAEGAALDGSDATADERRAYFAWRERRGVRAPRGLTAFVAGQRSIREPYEELVEAARALRDAELRLISTPYEMRQSWDEANDARARAYVVLDNAFREHDAHIEESLGGRK
ncbi:MAG: hypothetical protein WC211_01495 [Dehalococcoidia bacterium]